MYIWHSNSHPSGSQREREREELYQDASAGIVAWKRIGCYRMVYWRGLCVDCRTVSSRDSLHSLHTGSTDTVHGTCYLFIPSDVYLVYSNANFINLFIPIHSTNPHWHTAQARKSAERTLFETSSQTASVCEYQGHRKMRKFFASLLIPPFATMFMAVYLPRIYGDERK